MEAKYFILDTIINLILEFISILVIIFNNNHYSLQEEIELILRCVMSFQQTMQ